MQVSQQTDSKNAAGSYRWRENKCPLGNLRIQKNERKKPNALMKQGSEFTARRETIREREQVKKEKMGATRGSETGGQEGLTCHRRSMGERN